MTFEVFKTLIHNAHFLLLSSGKWGGGHNTA